MGWVQNRNRDTLAEEAAQAAEEGLTVFATAMHSMSAAGVTSGDLQVRLEWSRRIAAIEATGWRLEQWTVSHNLKGEPVGYPVFRRV